MLRRNCLFLVPLMALTMLGATVTNQSNWDRIADSTWHDKEANVIVVGNWKYTWSRIQFDVDGVEIGHTFHETPEEAREYQPT